MAEDVADVRSLTRTQARRLDEDIVDRDWSLTPDGFERVVFSAPSGQLAGFALGDPAAPRVVLAPGVTGSKEDFVLVMPLLARAGFRVISYDLAGQYESAAAGPERLCPPHARYDHELFVEDMIAVIESASSPVHLLGYSFAGTVAQLVTVARPDLVASLALLASPPMAGQAFRGMKRLGPVTGLASPAIGTGLMIWGVRNNFNRVLPGRVSFARARFSRTRRSSVRDVIDLMRRTPDLDEAVRTIGLPVLVAAGEHDLWPSDTHRAFARRLGARVAIYPTGHGPCETTPHELSRDLVELYDEAGASK